jgi:hypothetical protein
MGQHTWYGDMYNDRNLVTYGRKLEPKRRARKETARLKLGDPNNRYNVQHTYI